MYLHFVKMPLLSFTMLVIFGVVTSQNHDVNSQTPYRKIIEQRSVEATTLIPPDPRVTDEGIKELLTRLEDLCVEKLEYLITDTNDRFQSLENQSSEVHSTVDGIKDELSRINPPLTHLENLFVEKLDNLMTEVGRMSQCCSNSVSPVVPVNENLEVKVEDLSKAIQLLMDTIKILSSNVEMVKQNVSSLINNTRSVVDSASTTSTSSPLNITLATLSPRNCREVRESGRYTSGIYMLQPEGAAKPFEAVCDLETRGGNWTVIQRRYDGSQDFYLGWQDYKNGFGNSTGEFWIGLENIYLLTGHEQNELLVELRDIQSHNLSALYSNFSVGSEMQGYFLKSFGAYTGDAGDGLKYHAGHKFSTKDTNDINCANQHHGAWWYDGCAVSNLNGKYMENGKSLVSSGYVGIFWNAPYQSFETSYIYTRMLVRPKV